MLQPFIWLWLFKWILKCAFLEQLTLFCKLQNVLAVFSTINESCQFCQYVKFFEQTKDTDKEKEEELEEMEIKLTTKQAVATFQ